MHYLSRQATQKLDEAVKKFEVALRSYISNKIISIYPNEIAFKTELQQLYTNKSIGKKFKHFNIRNNIAELISNSTKSFYTIKRCKESYDNKINNSKVLYVSDLVNYFAIFYDKIFCKFCMTNHLGTIDEVIGILIKYNKIRNSLSHPASYLVYENDANIIIAFILKMIKAMDKKYFWYASTEEIYENIIQVKTILTGIVLKKDNLRTVSSCNNTLVCREYELSLLHDYIIGKDEYQRIAGSVAVFGYGGIGKTALVVEFIHRLIKELVDNGNKSKIDFILFFSSKDEFLEITKTTGEFYIEKTSRQIDSLISIVDNICDLLEIKSIKDISKHYKRGIIVIDNIENVTPDEKQKIFDFIKQLPRDYQFIITSRNEESCEEKLHIKEYAEERRGIEFIDSFIESESLECELTDQQKIKLIVASKGNTLILVQSMKSINEGVLSVEQLVNSLEQVRTKNSEIIADFMYKNTFEEALEELKKKEINVRLIIVIISLYMEKIDLYSIAKLSSLDIGTSEEVCSFLAKRMILIKINEFYSLNDFAKKFIFIKLLPDRNETDRISEKIQFHKQRMREKLSSLEEKVERNPTIKRTMSDWKPRNYIDRIIIAESFNAYGSMSKAIRKKSYNSALKAIADFKENELITNHPYIQFQKARIYQLFLKICPANERKEYLKSISRAYEDCIETIEFDYSYIEGTESNAAIQMLYGIFLLTEVADYGKAIRYLEKAKELFIDSKFKTFFDVRYYLIQSYIGIQRERNNTEYDQNIKRTIKEVLQQHNVASIAKFDIHMFKSRLPKEYRKI